MRESTSRISKRLVSVIRAIALTGGVMTRLHGCYPIGYNGSCQCPVRDSDGATVQGARQFVNGGGCSAAQLDAGCIHDFEPAGPHFPPDLPHEASRDVADA